VLTINKGGNKKMPCFTASYGKFLSLNKDNNDDEKED